MSQAARLMLAFGLVAGVGLAWGLWLDRWKARNGFARRRASGGDGGGSDGGSWFSGDSGGDGCGSDGGGDGGGGCD